MILLIHVFGLFID